MGMNLISCCHKCQEKCFHFRGEEQKTILPFYRAHSNCMRFSPNNVETFEDQLQEKNWMRDEGEYTEWELENET